METHHAYVFFLLLLNGAQDALAFQVPPSSPTRCVKFRSWSTSKEYDYAADTKTEEYRKPPESVNNIAASNGITNRRVPLYDSTVSGRPLGVFFCSEKDVFERQRQKPSQFRFEDKKFTRNNHLFQEFNMVTYELPSDSSRATSLARVNNVDETEYLQTKLNNPSQLSQVKYNHDDFSSKGEWLNESKQGDSSIQTSSAEPSSGSSENQLELVAQLKEELSQLKSDLDYLTSKDKCIRQFEKDNQTTQVERTKAKDTSDSELEPSEVQEVDDNIEDVELLKQRREELLKLKSDIDGFLMNTKWINQEEVGSLTKPNGISNLRYGVNVKFPAQYKPEEEMLPKDLALSPSYDPKIAEQRQRELNLIRCNPTDFDEGLNDWSSEFNYGERVEKVKANKPKLSPRSPSYDPKIAEQRQRELNLIRCNPDDFDTGINDWSSEFNYGDRRARVKNTRPSYSLRSQSVSSMKMAERYKAISKQISDIQKKIDFSTRQNVSRGYKDARKKVPQITKSSYSMKDKIFGN